MVYEPQFQNKGGRIASDTERVRLAHESLVYEFKLATNSNDFFIIDFDMLVKILAPTHRELAKSFQISVANDKEASQPKENKQDSMKSETTTDSSEENKEDKRVEEGLEAKGTQEQGDQKSEMQESSYSGIALMDSQYKTGKRNAYFDEYIENLSSHNWYIQNPELDKLMRLREVKMEINSYNLDSAFVLGRNILQSAEGSSGSAITFMENLSRYLDTWPHQVKQAVIDGMFFEIYFDSSGDLRTPPFKASYLEDILNNIEPLHLENSFRFINKQLKKHEHDGFVPYFETNKQFVFAFSFNNSLQVTKLECNGIDITSTYPLSPYVSVFSSRESLRANLGRYYGIPVKNVDVDELPKNMDKILTRAVNPNEDLWPF